jgi:UDP-N-acetylglucosamine--N-acetylmuramyl-(pentapeptide) pyrophosphoryl-undecaprenol N-acetylglucosamine transferase
VAGAAAVVGMGGYASAPAVVAARRERIAVVLHEQNAIPGLANRTLSRVASAVALSFPEAASRFPRRVHTVLTGNPVRETILRIRPREERQAVAAEGLSAFGLEAGRSTVVVFGGSLGALHVNHATISACRLLAERQDLQVLLITGPGHLETFGRDQPPDAPAPGLLVRVEGFVDRMELAYAVADAVVARAGASSVAEISALGIPSILIPYPHAVAGEQEANGRALERAGGAMVLLDADLTGAALARALVGVVDHPVRLASMAAGAASFGRPHAAQALADLVEEVVRR